MTYSDIQQRIWSNALSNYMRTLVGIIVGLLTFRMLYQHLSREEFGFWALLWSVFGYGILLDFGFGFAAQKRVAELSVSKDWQHLSSVLSTILFFYLGVAVVLSSVVALGSDQIIRFFDVPEESHADFQTVLIVFFAAIGLAFPLGIFPEILRGQQRISLANNIITTAMLLRLGVMGWAVTHGWGFLEIMLSALFFSLVPDLFSAGFALKHMPEVRLSPRLFSRQVMRETMAFSLFAYMSTATNIILGKTDQLVLGTTLGVGAVALYQAGAKVAEVFAQFTKQLQDTLSPAAAHLHASGESAALRDLLFRGTRWSALIATPLYVFCAFELELLLRLLTGDAAIAWETVLVAQVLLFWFYTSTLTHSVSKRIYMMSGHERRLMWLGMGEAVANLGLSLALVYVFRSVVAVAIGSLLPTLFFGWFKLWPWMARDIGLPPLTLLRRVLSAPLLACAPAVMLLAGAAQVPVLQSGFWLATFLPVSLAFVFTLWALWSLALMPEERAALRSRLPFVARFPAGANVMPPPSCTAVTETPAL